MTRRCSKCGTENADERLVACPQCRAPYSEKQNDGRLTPEERSEIEKQIWKRMARWLFGGFSVLTVISAVQLTCVAKEARDAAVEVVKAEIVERVRLEFETARIHQTVEEVASGQAAQVIQKQIQPALQQVQTSAAAASDAIDQAREGILKLEGEVAKIAEDAKPPTLELREWMTEPVENGIKLNLVLLPSKPVPLGPVVFLSRLPSNTTARIVDFRPASIAIQGGNAKTITPDGKSARLQFQPIAVGLVKVEVVVSGPTVIEISGSHGFKSQQFSIPRS